MQVAAGIGGYLGLSCRNRCEQRLCVEDATSSLKVRNLFRFRVARLSATIYICPLESYPVFCQGVKSRDNFFPCTRYFDDSALSTGPGPGLVDFDAALPAHREQPGLHESIQGRRQRITVEGDGFADVGPGPASWRCLHEWHDLVHFRNLLPSFTITALDPGLKIYHVHFQYVCTTHILCGATTDTIDSCKFRCLTLLTLLMCPWTRRIILL